MLWLWDLQLDFERVPSDGTMVPIAQGVPSIKEVHPLAGRGMHGIGVVSRVIVDDVR